MARVVALENGHDGRVYRRAGEVFDVPDSRLKDGSTWFTLVDKAPPPKPKPANARPPGAGPARGSAVDESTPGAGPLPGSEAGEF